MIEMRVDNLTTDPSTSREMVWLRSVEGSVMVPIEIGRTEYLAIYAELAGQRMPRPLTHDLLRTILDHFDAQVEEVQIVDLKDQIFYAELVLSCNGEQLRLDARPSDSIALALKFNAPIFMDGRIVQEVGFKVRAQKDGLELEALNPPVRKEADQRPRRRRKTKEVAMAVEDLMAETRTVDAELEAVSAEEQIKLLKAQMAQAVKEERYEDAGQIRDRISRLEDEQN